MWLCAVINNNLEYYAAWDDQPSLEKLGLRLYNEEKYAEAMVKLNRATAPFEYLLVFQVCR